MSNLLVIGGTGFFGKSILRAFREGGLDQWGVKRVLIMARHANRLRDVASELISESVELISADIAKLDDLPFADYVIHAAASTDARNYLNSPEVERQNIQAATLNYSRIAKTAHRKSKIVYTSSGAVYGAQPENLFHITEEFPLQSLETLAESKRDYAMAKRESELIIKTLGESGLSVSIARCFAFVGPFLPRNQHFAIGNFIEDGINGRNIMVRAKSPVFRSYLYSDDLVRWLMAMAESANPTVPIYNVGSDQGYSMREVAEAVGSFFGLEVQASDASTSTVDRYVPSIAKAKQELGLSVRLGLSEAIAATVEVIKQREHVN